MATGYTLEELNQLEAQQQPVVQRGYSLEELNQLEAQQQPTAQKGYTLEELNQLETQKPEEKPEAPQQGYTLEELDALATKKEFAPGQEVSRGFGAAVEGIKNLPNALQLQASSEMIPYRTKELEIFDRIDKGEEISPAEASRAKLDYAVIRNYTKASPERRQEYRDFNTAEIGKHQESVKEALNLYAQFQNDVAKYKGRTPNLTDVENVKDFGNWLAYNFGSGAAQIAPIMLSAVTMGTPGVMLTGSSMAMQEAIGNRLEFIQKQVKDLPEEDQAAAIADYLNKTGDVSTMVAIASGTLDIVGGPVGQILKKRLAADLGKEAVQYATKREAFKAGAKEVPKQMGAEFLTGGAQETAQIAGKRATEEQTGDIFSEENIKDVFNAAAAEAAGSTSGSAVNIGTQVGQVALQQRATKKAEDMLLAQLQQQQQIDPQVMDQLSTQFDEAVNKFREEGVTEAEAFRLAGELILQEKPNVEPDRTAEPPAEVVSGRIEPSLSLPSEGGTPAEVTAPPDTVGLDRAVGAAGTPDVGAGTEYTALREIPTLTERAPAAPVEQARANLVTAQAAVDAATTPAEKKAATKERNVARQALQKAEAQAPATETPAAETGTLYDQAVKVLQKGNRASLSLLQRHLRIGYKEAQDLLSQMERNGIVSAAKPDGSRALLNVPAAEPAAETPATVEAAPALSRDDAERLRQAKSDLERAQDELAYLASEGFTTPEQHYGVESAQKRTVRAQEIINELEPQAPVEAAPTVEAPVVEAPVEPTPTVEAAAPEKPRRGRPPKPKVEGEAVVPKAPAKRGRKKIQLTPEEQAVRATERKETQADLIKAGRSVDKLINIINRQFDPSGFNTLEEAQAGKAEYDRVRREALVSLAKAASHPLYRSAAASGVKAKQFLDSDAVTPLERQNTNERLKFEKERTQKATTAPNKIGQKPNRAYYKFKNATQALEYIAKTGTAFERALANRLKDFTDGVRLIIADTEENTPVEIQEMLGTASGVYNVVDIGGDQYKMIVLRGENFGDPDMQGVNNTIFLHEALHAATVAKLNEYFALKRDGMPVPRPLQIMMDNLNVIALTAQDRYDAMKKAGEPISRDLKHKFEDLGIGTDLHEFVTYGMTDPAMQQFLLETPGFVRKTGALGMFKNLFNKFTNTIRRAFNLDDKHQSAFQDLVLVTEGVMQEQEIEPAESIPTQVYAATNKKQMAIIRLRNGLANSRSATENNASLGKLVMQTRNAEDAIRLLKATYRAMDVSKVRLVLPTLTTDDITRWVGDKIKNLTKVNDAVQSMAGMRNRMIRELAEKIPAWVAFNKKYEEGGKLLGDVMHASTLKSVDPTAYANLPAALRNDPLMKKLDNDLQAPGLTANETSALKRQQTQRRNELTEVYRLWDDLGKFGNREGHKLYIMAKKAYADTFDLHEKLLNEKIDASGVPDDQKQKLLSAITKTFQEAKRMGVYFPLMRYGNFWFSVGKGPSGEFYMFESATARNNFMDKRIEELQKEGDNRTRAEMLADMDIDVGDDIRQQRNKVVESSKMLKDMFSLLEDGKVKDIDAIKDQIYQMYLMTLPDKDMRKKFTHRQGKTGFSADVVRNFVTSQHTAANQLARLAYADQIRNALGASYGELAGNPDKLKLSAFVDEVAMRAASEITPVTVDGIDWNKYATIGNQIVFYYMLTSPKSALTQMIQMPTVVLPAMVAEYGSSVPRVVARYSNLFRMMGLTKKDSEGNVITRWGQPSINDSMYIRNMKDPVYKAALTEAWNAANDRDIFMSTYASDMSARSATPTAEYHGTLSKATRSVLNFMSGAFHHTERINREITYMSTFELEYAKARKEGLSTADATARGIEKGIEMTYESLFNFSNYNKPRVMKNPITRVASQFMMFPLQMTSYLVRNFYGMLPYLNKEGKRDASIKFFGTLGMTTLFAGVTGLPMYSAIMGMAEGVREMFRGDDEDYDEDDEGNPLGKRSLDLWFRNWFLPTYFGEESSLAKALNLTPEQAEVLTRSVQMGPISAVTDVNLGSSVSLDGLWFRNNNPSKTSKDAFQQMAFDIAFGAFGSMGSQVASAFDDFNEGHFNRGVEKLLPAFFRGTATAFRLSEEGMKTRQGDEIKNAEFYTTGKLLAQVMGAGSTEVADIQKANFMARQIVVKIESEKTEILKNFDKALQRYDNNPTDANEEAVEKIMDRIERFNLKNGMLPITGETIAKSIQAHTKQRGTAYQGLSVSPKAAPYIYPLVEKSRSQEFK